MNLNDLTYTATVTVKDIYKTTDILIPQGYRVVGFRAPKVGDAFLTRGDQHVRQLGAYFSDDPWTGSPRLIVERIPRMRIVLEEVARGRKAEPGEYFLEAFETPKKIYDHTYMGTSNTIILRRRDEEF